jgi:hypothetical protein
MTASRRHNYPVGGADRRLPRGLQSKKDSKKEQVKLQVEVKTGFWTEV